MVIKKIQQSFLKIKDGLLNRLSTVNNIRYDEPTSILLLLSSSMFLCLFSSSSLLLYSFSSLILWSSSSLNLMVKRLWTIHNGIVLTFIWALSWIQKIQYEIGNFKKENQRYFHKYLKNLKDNVLNWVCLSLNEMLIETLCRESLFSNVRNSFKLH